MKFNDCIGIYQAGGISNFIFYSNSLDFIGNFGLSLNPLGRWDPKNEKITKKKFVQLGLS